MTSFLCLTCAGGSAGTGSGVDGTGHRKPPLFISLSAIRAARKSAAAMLAATATLVETPSPVKPAPPKIVQQKPPKPQAAMAAAAPGLQEAGSNPKSK